MKTFEGTAIFSDDEVYRYRLTRRWAEGESIPFIMLNPSTATAEQDDPTIRRCIGFAKSWGYGGLEVYNIFALRSTDPKALYHHPDPVGPDNEMTIRTCCGERQVICAWGAHGTLKGQGEKVLAWLRQELARPMALRLVGKAPAMPGHPLYLPAASAPFELAGVPS